MNNTKFQQPTGMCSVTEQGDLGLGAFQINEQTQTTEKKDEKERERGKNK